MDLTFPLYINLGIVNIHPHVFFEMLGWIAGLSLMFFLRRDKDDFTIEQRSWLILAAVVGAIFGAKLLAWIQHADHVSMSMLLNALLNYLVRAMGNTVGGSMGSTTCKVPSHWITHAAHCAPTW